MVTSAMNLASLISPAYDLVPTATLDADAGHHFSLAMLLTGRIPN